MAALLLKNSFWVGKDNLSRLRTVNPKTRLCQILSTLSRNYSQKSTTTTATATGANATILQDDHLHKSLPFRKIPNNRRAQKYYNKKQKRGDAENYSDLFEKRSSTVVDDPELYRIFFRSPDKIYSLEEAQVFISHIKFNYGPLTQYQFARCPETKKYFGYGFLTFKKEESLQKALADGYIRVGLKDFELKRTGHMPSSRSVIYKHTGFYGFFDINELRAARAKQLQKQQQQQQGQGQGQGQGQEQITVEGSESMSEQQHNSNIAAASIPSEPERSIIGGEDRHSSEPFKSALPLQERSSVKATASIQASTQQQQSAVSESTVSPDVAAATVQSGVKAKNASKSTEKPFYIKLEKKGLSQLWKAGIVRSEKTLNATGEQKQAIDGDVNEQNGSSSSGRASQTISKQISSALLNDRS
ncbi:hypothetical protein BX616_001121 [Lobosporangium transversale]|uniref:RRM domain-containing protein n=1 Tax=Lobosporangium transversale TaxID=64571 RepID=A0A1Y2GA62_9FUNG|nr:hypothetical protein BCR41DRAFT_426222 [Lobosporangium transversale]KAF9917403.1 hypothetical protein BX616_001121 [Lobosporangium transversale]ORZ01819.1 hypothetical protein BCR41DRAFT_426222 [Lobosporangium transversale]|eukprot:XP_021876116.1 hypothetical protein BCR41DRAFT_426222 [Lobosporangium transversale]